MKKINLYNQQWNGEKQKKALYCENSRIITTLYTHETATSDHGVCLSATPHQLHVKWESGKDCIECFGFNPVTDRYEWSEDIPLHQYQHLISSRKLKVAIMCSAYRRLSRLVGQIHTLLNQTHPPEKVFIAVKGYSEKDIKKHVIKHFLGDDRVIIKCTPNRHMLSNIIDPVRGENIDNLDLIIKIDDDDMYPVDFIEKAVKDFVQAKSCDPKIAGMSYTGSEAIRDNGRDVGQNIVRFSWSPGNILGYIIGVTPKVLRWLFLYEIAPDEALKKSVCPIKTNGNDDQFICEAIKACGGMFLGKYMDGVVYNNIDCSLLRNRNLYSGITRNHNMTTWNKSGHEQFLHVEGRLARIYNHNNLTWVDSQGKTRVPCKFLGDILIIDDKRYVYHDTEAEYKKLNRPDQPSYQWGVCAVSLLRDSIYWIEDWIDYHIKMGASKIIIYDNSASQKGRKGNGGAYAGGELQSKGISKRGEKYLELTKHLSDRDIREQVDAIADKHPGIVEIVTWKPYDSLEGKIVFDHVEAQDHCLKRYRTSKIGWIAFIDLDEYLYCPPGITIESILRQSYKKHPHTALLRFEERISRIRWEQNGPGDIAKLTKVLLKPGPAVKNIARLDHTGRTSLHDGYLLDQDSVYWRLPIDQLCIVHYKGTPEKMKADGIELNIREIAGKPADPSIEIKFN